MADKNINIENARIAFRNFEGKETRFNPVGRRNFCVFLEHEVAEALKADGWNVRTLEPRDPEDSPQPYLQVAVSFTNFPPKIIMITSQKSTPLTESQVNILDWAEIDNVDLVIRPYNWDVNGKTGVKAYLKTMYVTIAEDVFESKYRDVPTASMQDDTDDD